MVCEWRPAAASCWCGAQQAVVAVTAVAAAFASVAVAVLRCQRQTLHCPSIRNQEGFPIDEGLEFPARLVDASDESLPNSCPGAHLTESNDGK